MEPVEPVVVADFLGQAPIKGSIDVLYDEAWLAYSDGRHAEALAALDRVLSTVADYARARFARGLCLLELSRPAEAERELSTYLALVAHQQLNTCDAHFFRAMALSRLGSHQRALADLDKAIAFKPGCGGGCACGMFCRASEAVLARFALLLSRSVRADYTRAREQAAMDDLPADSEGTRSEVRVAEQVDEAARRLAFTLDGPCWCVPMHQLWDALERAHALRKVPLLVDDSADRSVDASFLYTASTIVELKQLVVRLRTRAELTLDDAREELRAKLVHAMRWGHNLVLRLGTSAPDFDRLCSPEHFPAELLAGVDAVPIGANLVGHPLGAVLRAGDAQAGVFVVADAFRIVVTCNFAANKYAGYLTPSFGPKWAMLQPICVVTQTSFGDGRADLVADDGGRADGSTPRSSLADTITEAGRT